MELPIDISQVKGFMGEAEGEALYQCALEVGGPCLEIGSYCGKSTVYLGLACKANNTYLIAIDHHRGSEEHQPGEEYHDADLFDSEQGVMDSFREFRRTISRAGLKDHVVPIVAGSVMASRYWNSPLAMVFIDGGHSLAAAQADYRSWMPHVAPGGILAIHDIFPDPEQGGQAPYTIYQQAIASGLFETMPLVDTLGLLRRID